MDTTRIKIKIGEHEFEAEGPAETVQSQFEAFKELMRDVASKNQIKTHEQPQDSAQPPAKPQFGMPYQSSQLDKIMHISGRVISLTALPSSTEDAALLIMLGHKDMRNNHSVTGQEIGDGLAQSGRPVPRVDRIMDKAIAEALVLKIGLKRATRYRLTNQGHAKAVNVAHELVSSLP